MRWRQGYAEAPAIANGLKEEVSSNSLIQSLFELLFSSLVYLPSIFLSAKLPGVGGRNWPKLVYSLESPWFGIGCWSLASSPLHEKLGMWTGQKQSKALSYLQQCLVDLSKPGRLMFLTDNVYKWPKSECNSSLVYSPPVLSRRDNMLVLAHGYGTQMTDKELT